MIAIAKKTLSSVLSAALIMLSSGLQPYEALANTIKGGGVVAPEGLGAPIVEPIQAVDPSVTLDAGLELSAISAEVGLPGATLGATPTNVSRARGLAAAEDKKKGGLGDTARELKTGAKKGDAPNAEPVGKLFDRVGPSKKAGAFETPAGVDAPAYTPIESAGLGAAPDAEPEPGAKGEALLGKFSVSYAIETIIEDLPEGRGKVIAAFADPAIGDFEKIRFYKQVSAGLQQALSREGVPSEMLPIARGFASEVEEKVSTSGGLLAIQVAAAGDARTLGEPSPAEKAVEAKAALAGLDEAQALLAAKVSARGGVNANSPAFYKDVARASTALKAAGVSPFASLVGDAVRAASTPRWLDALTFGRYRTYKLDRAIKRTTALKAALETREPDIFNDREVDVYYSQLSQRIDVATAGYFGYRKRVHAAREFIRWGKLTGQPTDSPTVGSVEFKNAYEPFDASGVDRGVILSRRQEIVSAHEDVSSLKALADPRLAGVRTELTKRAWAYLQLWPEAEKDPRSKDKEGRAVPVPSKQIRGYLDKQAADVELDDMVGDLRAGGRYLFISLQAAIGQLLAQPTTTEEQRQGLQELMFRNMIGYQWTDDVAKAELNFTAGLDKPAEWKAVEIKLALDRLGYIYFDKSQEFQAFRTGVFAPEPVKKLLSAGRKAAKEQDARIIKNRGNGQEETVRLDRARSVDALFRGFCGRDCSKSLAPERGKLVLWGRAPYVAVYIGKVDGKAIGYIQLIEAKMGEAKVLLAEIVQFPEREAMTPKILEALDREAKSKGYAGVAVPSQLHPWDPVAKENVANFTNFHNTVKSVKNMKAFQDGTPFQPTVPAAFDAIEATYGKVPYFSWRVADGTYKLLKFEEGAAPDSTGPPSKPESNQEKGRRILEGYFKGQRWLIASFAMYYSLFPAVANAMLGPSGTGNGRMGYAGALAVLSPIAGVLVEKFPVRTILIAMSAARAIIWAGIVPLGYFLLGPTLGFGAVFLGAMVLDGAAVSINALVDIDEMGVDALGQQHGFTVDDALRNEYNARLEKFYSVSRIVLPTIMAGLGIVAAGILNSATVALVGIMALSFAIPSAMSILHYSRSIPSEAHMPAGKKTVRQLTADFVEGLKISWANKKIRYRIGFYALERAREDAMLFIVLAEIGMQVLGQGDKAWGAFYTAVLIALGKIGAWASSHFMEHHWKAPTQGEARWPKYKMFFPLAFAGSLATLLVPIGLGITGGAFWPSFAVAALASILFNVLCTASALGNRNLMQGIVTEAGGGTRVMGIVSTVLMGTNAVAIAGLAYVFVATGLSTAFLISTGVFALIGALEMFVAPRLLFTAEERQATAKK